MPPMVPPPTTHPDEVRRSLVIPMFDEAERIGGTLRLLAGSPLAGEGHELLLVDDGSADGTAELAEKQIAELGLANARVIRSALNRGKGAAVRAGMLAARGHLRVFADADLSAGVDDIIRCFDTLVAEQADVVFASRAHPDSTIADSQPGHRVATGRAFNLVLRTFRLTTELDTQCGLKGFTADAAHTIFSAVTIEGFAFDVEVLALAERDGMRIVRMPLEWSHVDASRVRPLRDGAAMLRDVIALRRAIRRAGPSVPAPGAGGQMAVEKFEIMSRLERDHWWFRAKQRLLELELGRRHDGSGVACDVGCGTGSTLPVLTAHADSVIGVEFDGHAAALASSRQAAGVAVVRGSAGELPLASGSVDVLTSLDVVEHLDDDVAALREYRRVVRPGGLILLTVPAYQWAWSRHDEVLGHRRRYTAARLRDVADAAGVEVERVTYFHSWLTPLAAVVRKTPIRRLVRGDEEEVSYVHPHVNRLLGWIATAERRVLRSADVPVGLSILLVGRAPGGPRPGD
ncbi:methyltransferase domain-containing protein [Actinomarinicola tropica]|uniref:dolichyl-phosphate beta-glucosyltransferase n=1 Tax=Actinomarinicola tropica TaxID=2789776 RepID=A0A5Q2RIJ3_9ACTN|nr:methyltransferase domain-containing protein [Actinomarinicola tropica]QGG95354.1 glycosyltransferase [Actinomarinicola tropica]